MKELCFKINNYKNGINYLGEIEGSDIEFITDWHIGGRDKDKALELVNYLSENRSGCATMPELTERHYDMLMKKSRALNYERFVKVQALIDRLI